MDTLSGGSLSDSAPAKPFFLGPVGNSNCPRFLATGSTDTTAPERVPICHGRIPVPGTESVSSGFDYSAQKGGRLGHLQSLVSLVKPLIVFLSRKKRVRFWKKFGLIPPKRPGRPSLFVHPSGAGVSPAMRHLNRTGGDACTTGKMLFCAKPPKSPTKLKGGQREKSLTSIRYFSRFICLNNH